MQAKEITLEHMVEVFKIYEKTMLRKEMPTHTTPPEAYQLLQEAITSSQQQFIREGYRVGSKWTGHSKLRFRIENDGSFVAFCDPNMDYGDSRIKTAEKAAKLFEKKVLEYLSK